MKKILLGTTALIGALAIAGAASAQGPKVTVGGFADFQAGYADQEEVFGDGYRDFNMQNDTEVHIMVDGKSDTGLGYGAVIELEADVTADADAEGLNADKTYLYLESGWGRFEMGNVNGAQNNLRVDASTFARATGGIDGDFYDYADFLYITPELPTSWLKGNTEDATKVNYYSPRWSGVQLGLSYTTDTGNAGTAAGFSGDLGNDWQHVIGGGLNYEGQMGAFGIAASATGEWGENENVGNDLESYAFGLNLTYAGFTFGGSWFDWSDSIGIDVDGYTAGIGYDFGPFGTSLTWLSADMQGLEDTDELSLGVDYQLAPGLTPYAEVTWFDGNRASTPGVSNDGSVFILGTKLAF